MELANKHKHKDECKKKKIGLWLANKTKFKILLKLHKDECKKKKIGLSLANKTKFKILLKLLCRVVTDRVIRFHPNCNGFIKYEFKLTNPKR